MSGTDLATFQYAEMMKHQTSGLYLTTGDGAGYAGRNYDPNTARWLGRDPIKERGGLNLYEYVFNNPVKLTDPEGLQAIPAPYAPPLAPPLWVYDAALAIANGVVIAVAIDVAANCPAKKCKPCDPPVGTKAIERTYYPPSKPHGPIPTPHSHIVQVNQSPYPACKCFWNDANPDVVPGVPPLPSRSQFTNPPGG